MRRLYAATLLLAVPLLLALFGLMALFALAPDSDASLRIGAFLGGIAHLRELIRDRDSRCPIADTLAAATSSATARREHYCERNTKIIRRDGDTELLLTPFGEFWIPRRDYHAVIEELAEQSMDVYALSNQIGRGDVVLDCGANVGIVSRRALARGASLVVAIEPGPEPLACLRRTFDKEIAEGRLILYPKGVWDKDDELVLTVSDDLASTANSVALNRGKKGPTVQLTTIDHIVGELKLTKVSFIKMDIEGAEPNALRGAAGTLAAFRPRLSISLEHRRTDPAQIPALIQQLRPDYKLVCGPCTRTNGAIQPIVVFAN
jgi:FkbM family methyltransferase